MNRIMLTQWSRQDFEDFIGYYRLTDSRFANATDEEYAELSPSQSVLAILEHTGMDDAGIMRAMNLTNGALRTLRSRLKQRKAGG